MVLVYSLTQCNYEEVSGLFVVNNWVVDRGLPHWGRGNLIVGDGRNNVWGEMVKEF